METQAQTQDNATGEMLRTLRETLHLTIGDVARRTGISKSTLSLYETGQRMVENGKRRQIVAVFADEMLARTGGAR